MIDALPAAEEIPGDVRAAAVEFVRAGGDHPNWINGDAWEVCRRPSGTPAEHALALRKARLAAAAFPDDYGVLNTLGVAEFRCGELDAALQTLTNSRRGASLHTTAQAARAIADKHKSSGTRTAENGCAACVAHRDVITLPANHPPHVDAKSRDSQDFLAPGGFRRQWSPHQVLTRNVSPSRATIGTRPIASWRAEPSCELALSLSAQQLVKGDSAYGAARYPRYRCARKQVVVGQAPVVNPPAMANDSPDTGARATFRDRPA